MINGRDNVLHWFNALPQPVVYWKLYQQGQKSSGYASSQSSMEEGLTKADSFENLRKALSFLHYGKYSITAQDKPNSVQKGAFTDDFEISFNDNVNTGNNNNNNAQQPQAMVGYISKDEADKIAEEKFEKLMTKQKLNDALDKIKLLEKENQELKDDNSSPLNQIAGMVLPHLMQKVAPVVPIEQPLAQVGTLHSDDNIEMTEEDQQAVNRLQTVLNKTKQLFGEPSLPFLEKLIAYVEANPHFVGMIKGMIK